MRVISLTALIVGVCLIPSALGVAKLDHDRRLSELERTLRAETDEHGGALENYFERARSVVLLTANSPAFARVLGRARTRRRRRCAARAATSRDVTHQLGYLERLYPSSIGEACFIDAHGEEFARVVRGRRRAGGGSVDRGGADGVLRADVRARLRAGPPDPAVRLAGHQRVGRRQRDADPAGRRPASARSCTSRSRSRASAARWARSDAVASCGSSTAAPAAS